MDHIHLIGIGGTGLSAIAKVLLERGYQVSGSDLRDSALAASVAAAGAKVMIGHRAENLRGADIVVRSSAVPEDNVEVEAAQQAGIPVLKRADFLSRLLEEKDTIAVAGSHGKTTTTAMIAWMLTALEQDPSFIVGGVVENLGTNARSGAGKLFVIEADEYDYMFLGLEPTLAVVTNVEHDHPDLFPTAEAFFNAFEDFLQRLKPGGKLIYCADDPGAKRLSSQLRQGQKSAAYGVERSGVSYLAKDLILNQHGGYDFTIENLAGSAAVESKVSLQVPGKHNVLNALAAFAAADQLHLSAQQAAQTLAQFKGSERRFDIRGEYDEVVLIDDYGHHPTEIKASLAAARNLYGDRRLWALWQPHTYTRTLAFFEDYQDTFTEADQVVILDVYAAREERPEGFDMAELADRIHHPAVAFQPDLPGAVQHLQAKLERGDVLLVFTAGDAIKVTEELETIFQGKD